MPIVFVHGVNNRSDDPAYELGVRRTGDFLRGILAPEIGLQSKHVALFFPYWGDHGVRFRWRQASLPSMSEQVEALSIGHGGPGSADYELWIGEARFQYGPSQVNFGQLSRNAGFETAVDAVWDTAAAATQPEQGYANVLDAYQASMAYARATPAPPWALQAPISNEAFVTKLLEAIGPALAAGQAAGAERLGLADWWAGLREAGNRLENAPADAATALLGGLFRKQAHIQASRFLGDIFIYLSQRGTRDAPGPIVRDVVDALDQAAGVVSADDAKLVVIGHSLGGVILYDILTTFRPDLRFDAFATIGSQVAVFEEMGLYCASAPTRPPNPPADLLDQPHGAGKWLNVFDTNDMFSFKAATVFKGPTDYRFDTGYGLLQSHSGYFARPSFYKRLGARLAALRP